MFYILEIGIMVITMVTFFLSAYTKDSKNYVYIGVGSFLMLAGRNILINSDNLITLIPGATILVIGTLMVCARLHREYLWL
jgi:predicted membrane protein